MALFQSVIFPFSISPLHNTSVTKLNRLITFSNVIFSDPSGCSLAGTVDSNPAGGMDVCLVCVIR
jgi:hypothetical protein